MKLLADYKFKTKQNSKIIYFLFGWPEKLDCHLCAQGSSLEGEKMFQRETLFKYKSHVQLKDELGGGGSFCIFLFVLLSVAMLNKSFSTFHFN